MPKPYNPKGRSTDAVVEARVDQLIQVLAARPQSRKSELRRTFTQEWGVHWRTVDRFVSRAREEIIKRLGRTKEEFRAESLSFYERVASDPKASHSDKLYARKLVDDLLGTWAPRTTLVGNVSGESFKVQSESKPVTKMTGEELDAILQRAVELGVPGLLAAGRLEANGVAHAQNEDEPAKESVG